MSVEVSDAAEQYASERYQRTVEIERRIEDGITTEECYDRETDFSLNTAQVTLEPGDRILDLCCGVGEHADRMRARTGADIDAYDLADKAIAAAASREEIRQRTAGVHGKISFALGDMGKILEKVPPGRRYKMITILGSSFIYLSNKAAYQKALEDYYSLLEPGGKLVLQFRPGKPKDQRKEELRARAGVFVESRIAEHRKGRGIKTKEGETFEIMRDMQQEDGVYYYGVDGGRSVDADGVTHYGFGRVYVRPDGKEEDMGTAHITDFWDGETRGHPQLLALLQSVGFKNIREEIRPLSDEGVHDMAVLVAEK